MKKIKPEPATPQIAGWRVHIARLRLGILILGGAGVFIAWLAGFVILVLLPAGAFGYSGPTFWGAVSWAAASVLTLIYLIGYWFSGE